MKREHKACWCVDYKRGDWFAVDRASGRRIKAHGRERAAQLASSNNRRELDGAAKIPAALVWG